ncbi:hypothetical protein SAMN05216480_10688 [Pustulibacterium marinum]|uniref:Uncharacterized protein n=1 Tax=Pustulibacterium marinum TaxID=1224947 RepID=A0A1I7GY51_9FLAO|nr:hypothetical protein [Pustulibacterium marinum]SFU53361.1 hypothetical protein SAMN05216480_10688 [Pustulibacterium marinum]
MNWAQAEILLKEKIVVTNKSLDSSGKSKYKIVKHIPDFYCSNYNEVGFQIQVGANAFINVPMSMLQKVFKASLQNGYEKAIFNTYYPKEYNNKPCYVHAIGLLFQQAGVMLPVSSRKYKIVK